MIREKESTAVLIVIFFAIGVLGYFMVVIMGRLQALQADINTGGTTPVDVSGWEAYRNDTYGFELQFPSTWKVLTYGLDGDPPFVTFGNPPSGTSTYVMQVFIENNPKMLSSGGYVHDLLDAARAEDAANAAIAPAPQKAPHFDKAYVLTVGGHPAYELYNVFEFDRGAERIYVAHGSKILRFDFPVAKENPNISLPVANGQIAHEIMNTLVFTK
jgi:hypothetical protein